MNFFDLWWGALIFFGFLVVEIWAAVDKHPGGTLSELVWKIYIHPKRNAHYTRFIFGGFWAALTLHGHGNPSDHLWDCYGVADSLAL